MMDFSFKAAAAGLIQLSPVWSLSLMAFIPLTIKTLNQNREIRPSITAAIHALGILTSLALLLLLGFKSSGAEHFSLRFDMFGSGACALVALASLQCLPLFAASRYADKKQLSEILFLFSHAAAALYVFSLSQDFITAFIGLETASLLVYMMLALSRKDTLCLEAALKYFILSSFAGAVFLYGISFVFGASGTLSFDSLAQNPGGGHFYSRFFFLGFALIFAGLFFKMAVFPFQFWLADVYQGALTPMTCFMATALKAAAVLFAGKVFALQIFDRGAGHGQALLLGLEAIAAATLLFGSFMALRQARLKRLAAFSSLAHSGYMMMALAALLNLPGEKDFRPLFYYLLAYIFMTGGLLAGLQSLEKKSSQPKMEDLKGLFQSRPGFALLLSLFLLGLAGLPPAFGFFAKLALFQPLLASRSWWMLLWAFVGFAAAVYYYIKPVTVMLAGRFAGEGEKPEAPDHQAEALEPGGKTGGGKAAAAEGQAASPPPAFDQPWPLKALMACCAAATVFGGFVFGFFFG